MPGCRARPTDTDGVPLALEALRRHPATELPTGLEREITDRLGLREQTPIVLRDVHPAW